MCSAPNLCELVGGAGIDAGVAMSGQFNNHGHDGGGSSGNGGNGYIEMPRKEVESWAMSGIDDTWLLVLVASSIGVLLLGALLAMFLLKCREMNIFSSNDCSMHDRDNHHAIHRQLKAHHEVREVQTSNNTSFTPNTKLVHPSETVLYHHNGPTSGSLHQVMDNRMVWAALTPRGTQHFFSAEDSYDPTDDMADYGPEVEDHYETIDGMAQQNNQLAYKTYGTYPKDYEYEDPAPFIEAYHHNHSPSCNMNTIANNNRNHHHRNKHANQSTTSSSTDYTTSSTSTTGASTLSGNTDMRCAASILLNGMGSNPSHSHHSHHNGAISGTMKRSHGHSQQGNSSTLYRPRVSEPTRIENPNLPPLNLMFQPGGQPMMQGSGQIGPQSGQPSRGNTLKKNGLSSNGTLTLSQIGAYRNGGGDTLPKFA